MISRIERYVREHQMIQAKDKIIVGISGGADSVCLLFVLTELREKLDFELRAVHVNHGLRGEEADRDEAFVKALCQEQGVPLRSYFCEVRKRAEEEKLSLEEAGRLCRYELFEREAKREGANRIAVAHHANDQAETMLFHLFRGTGIKGLAGMEPVRGKIIRPLLCLEREEILSWLKEKKISWCTDSTNAEEDYTRNRIRHSILACAKEQVNEAAVRHMAEAAEELRETENFLEEETEKAFRLCVREEEQGCFVFAESFGRLNALLQGRLLRRILGLYGGLKDVDRRHIRLLEELLEKQTGSLLDLPGERRAEKTYGGLRIFRTTPVTEAGTEHTLRVEIPGIYQIGGKTWAFSWEKKEKLEGIPEKTYTKWFDYDKIIECLEIRGRLPGDYLEVNREHGRKKLKDYLIDQKIPGWEREALRVLADGSHVLWIPGRRISEKYKVTEETKTILKVQIYGGNENG